MHAGRRDMRTPTEAGVAGSYAPRPVRASRRFARAACGRHTSRWVAGCRTPKSWDGAARRRAEQRRSDREPCHELDRPDGCQSRKALRRCHPVPRCSSAPPPSLSGRRRCSAWHERPGALERLTPPWEQVRGARALRRHRGRRSGRSRRSGAPVAHPLGRAPPRLPARPAVRRRAGAGPLLPLGAPPPVRAGRCRARAWSPTGSSTPRRWAPWARPASRRWSGPGSSACWPIGTSCFGETSRPTPASPTGRGFASR